jgi:hypothetical protein
VSPKPKELNDSDEPREQLDHKRQNGIESNTDEDESLKHGNISSIAAHHNYESFDFRDQQDDEKKYSTEQLNRLGVSPIYIFLNNVLCACRFNTTNGSTSDKPSETNAERQEYLTKKLQNALESGGFFYQNWEPCNLMNLF